MIISRSVARKFSIGALCSSAGGLHTIKFTQTPLNSVSRSNLGGLRALLGGKSPPVATGLIISSCCLRHLLLTCNTMSVIVKCFI